MPRPALKGVDDPVCDRSHAKCEDPTAISRSTLGGAWHLFEARGVLGAPRRGRHGALQYVLSVLVHRCDDAAEFLAETIDYRDLEPLRTNVLGSVATVVASGELAGGEAFWWLVRDDTGRVVGAAMRTAPYALSLGPMPAASAEALAVAVAPVDVGVPAVAGFTSTVDAFLAAYRATTSMKDAAAARSSQRQILYAATAVEVPDVPGELSVATTGELELAIQWHVMFDEEVDGVGMGSVNRAIVAYNVASGRLRWWRDGGEVVSMAGHASPVTTPGAVVTRIGPVFTPSVRRGHGYAAALTGQLTEQLLASGSAVMLFADEANPTSNRVYRRLGFTALDELVRAPLATVT
jgi:predicted GNAT family acetyltransferase